MSWRSIQMVRRVVCGTMPASSSGPSRRYQWALTGPSQISSLSRRNALSPRNGRPYRGSARSARKPALIRSSRSGSASRTDVGAQIGEELPTHGRDVVLVPLGVVLALLARCPDRIVVELLIESLNAAERVRADCSDRPPARSAPVEDQTRSRSWPRVRRRDASRSRPR